MNRALNDFPKKTRAFLNKLSKNNNREWFETNRDKYNSDFLEPCFQFVVEMGDKLQDLDPEIVAIPKIDKSIFRLHRDVRFSKDKTPYKTNAGLYFWNGKVKKMEASGFYFHLEPKLFGVGLGMYMFPPQLLKKYRDVVSTTASSKELHQIVRSLEKKGYSIGGQKFKKTPKGYDSNIKYPGYLLFEGIYAWFEGNDFKKLDDGKAVTFIFKIFKDMLPLHKWLVKKLLS
ncbi:MAG: DUF2461 domain-containing protein [Ignavibacteriaceae bacterium]|nr:DUF2461 domain-containing protein [Ignavibacteriaceae bacterium]